MQSLKEHEDQRATVTPSQKVPDSLEKILLHFHLKEDPFGTTPNPRFLFASENHNKALAALEHGIQCNRGFLVLVAPPGLGKTTLLYHLLGRYRSTRIASTAFIFQTQCTSRELIRQIFRDLGVGADEQDAVKLHEQFNQFLVREARAGRHVVLFIDEAQDLQDEVLETVRLLSNFETYHSKLLQVVLCGQPSLATKLARPSLLQLRQRVFCTVRLEPLSRDEASDYIEHRLRIAGYQGPELFSPRARTRLVAASGGVPRVVNALCFRALMIGSDEGAYRVDEEIAAHAIDDLGYGSPTHARPIQPLITVPTTSDDMAADEDDGDGTPHLFRSVRVRDKVPMSQLPGVISAIRSAESELDGHGYVVIRYSNRENTVRVMVEAENEGLTRKYLDAIASALQFEIGA